MSKYILGLSFYYHDSAACLLKDGEIVAAAEEERFSRIKHDADFPKKAIEYCLQEANLSIQDIDSIVFYEKPLLKFERVIFSFLNYWPFNLWIFPKTLNLYLGKRLRVSKTIRKTLSYNGNISYTHHHESHAAASYYFSKFKSAAVVTIDGVGEWTTTAIYKGAGSRLHKLKEMRYPDSLGLFYSAFTSFCGFQVNEGEYKLMGLAPYGEPLYYDLIRKNIFQEYADSSFELNLSYFKFQYGKRMLNLKKVEKLLGIKERQINDELHQDHKDVAASVQKVLEEIIIKICNHASEITGEDNLCLAGGVALNCVANSRIINETPFKELEIFPSPGDSGGAVGAAFLKHHQIDGAEKNDKVANIFLGPSFSNEKIKEYLDAGNIEYTFIETDKLLETVANDLKDQKVIGWFQGRMEFGPRALGNRSILADARGRKNWDRVNLLIKNRESFRPLAPVILYEKISEYYDWERESPYMQYTVKSITEKLPATTHVDGSARLQTVKESDNPLFYKLLKEFEKQTDTPVLLNTSFNNAGMPIVCTPDDAYKCFKIANLDSLILGNFYIKN